MKEDLYICTHDYQGGDFGFYRALNIEEWRKQALDWTDSDNSEELYDEINRLPRKFVIQDIQDTWEIELKKINKDAIVKYFVEKSKDFNNFAHILRRLLGKLKENNIIFEKNEWENDLFYNEIDRIINFFEKSDKEIYENCED